MADENTQTKKEETKKRPKRQPNKNYALKKRLPVKPIDGENVIFITKKTNFKVRNRKMRDVDKTRTCFLLHKFYFFRHNWTSVVIL